MRKVALVLLVLLLPTAVSLVVYFAAKQKTVPTRRDAIAEVTTLAGNAAPGSDDGPALSASFSDPFGIAVDRRGDLYVADGGDGNRIRRITTQGKVETIAGSGEGFTDGPARAARFNTPSGIAIDRRGNIIIADTSNSRIRKLDTRGYVSTIAGSGKAGFEDGPAADAKFDGPIGVAVDESGNILVADAYNDRIRRVSADGQVTTVAGAGMPGLADGDAPTATFDTPCGIAADRAGNIFVADTGNNAIRQITPAGEVLTLAGGTRGRRDGQGKEASFDHPSGIALTHDGFLFVTDEASGLVRRVTPEGEVSTYAGYKTGFADGTGDRARFSGPAGIAVDTQGSLFVCDNDNYLIRLIVPASSPPSASSIPGQAELFVQPFDSNSIEAPARVIPRIDASETGSRTGFPWPLYPQDQWHEVTGVMGEARGAAHGVALQHLHSGLDIGSREGEPVLSVRDEKVSSPIPDWGFNDSGEGIRVGLISYIHLRVGRNEKDEVNSGETFSARRDQAGTLSGVRVRRGTRFKAGDLVGTVNSQNHVHLNLGPWNAQANPMQLPFIGFTDTVRPEIEPKGIEVFGANGEALKEKRGGRLVLSGDVKIVVTAYDKVDGNKAKRKLGLYRVGYQLLDETGTPAKGFEQPLMNLEFNRLPPDDEAVNVAYATGSGVGAYGTPTKFKYVVTSRVRDGDAREGALRTTSLAGGRYLLKVIAEDFAGNRATGKLTELPIIVDNR